MSPVVLLLLFQKLLGHTKFDMYVFIIINLVINHEWGKEGPDCDYDKQSISVVICDTDIP
jgi:hypothetical protein